MSRRGPSEPGIYDADDWLNTWKARHPTANDEFVGRFSRFALAWLTDPSFSEGPGRQIFTVTEVDQQIEVMVEYLLEEYPSGKVLHILSIRSPGDPPTPTA